MTRKTSCGILLAVLCLAGCDSGGSSESEQEREHASSPGAALVRQFYDAANDADGASACGLLTDAGIRTVVRVKTRAECIRTISGFAQGSFETDKGELVEIEGVDENHDGFDVDAVVKGRTTGTYAVVRRNGRLLIDGFSPEEG
jgi:hypothetical protein